MEFLKNAITDPSFNSSNHRCKEIEDVLGPNLDFRKYFLVLGDNAGLHMHKPIEETWPHMLSQELGYRYYNACIIDGGLEAVRFNLMIWLHKYSHNLPKMIYISCDWANRFFGVNYEDEIHDIQQASNLADTSGYFLGRQQMFSMLVNQLNIPVYQILHPGTATQKPDVPVLVSDTVTNVEIDHADDQAVAERLLKDIRDRQRAISV